MNDVALLMVRTASPSLVSAMRAETKSKNSSSCTILRVPPVRHHPWQPSGARALKSTIPSVAHRHRRRRFPHRKRTLCSTPFDERLWALNSSSAPRASWAFSSCATAAVGSRALATTTPTRRSRSTSPLNRRKHLLLSQTMALRSNNSITIIHYSSFVVQVAKRRAFKIFNDSSAGRSPNHTLARVVIVVDTARDRENRRRQRQRCQCAHRQRQRRSRRASSSSRTRALVAGPRRIAVAAPSPRRAPSR